MIDGQVRQRIQWWLDLQQLLHALDVGHVAGHFHGTRRLQSDMSLAIGKADDSPRQINDPCTSTTTDIDRRKSPPELGGAHQCVHNLTDPDEIDYLFAAVDLEIASGARSLDP